jgi:hypothetical protein
MGEALSFLLAQGHSDRTLAPNAPPQTPCLQAKAHRPLPDQPTPRHPALSRAVCRQAASLFSPEPPATPAQTEKFLHVALCVEFAKTAGALAALAPHLLLAEPIL